MPPNFMINNIGPYPPGYMRNIPNPGNNPPMFRFRPYQPFPLYPPAPIGFDPFQHNPGNNLPMFQPHP